MNSFVKAVDLEGCSKWTADIDVLRHVTSRYFSIRTFVSDNIEHVLIDQPEVGILGFIFTQKDGQNWFLLQDKPEPGNAGIYQFGPTVQATKSNYERIHGGKETPYLSYFLKGDGFTSYVEGSEQGGKFINKFNLNVEKRVEDLIEPVNETYVWYSASELKKLVHLSYKLNTDARSVLVSGDWLLFCDDESSPFLSDSSLSPEQQQALNASLAIERLSYLDETQTLLERQQLLYPLPLLPIKFSEMQQHVLNDKGIFTHKGEVVVSYFDIFMPEREVSRWQQPLLHQLNTEYCVLIFKIVEDIAFFFLGVYPEIGFKDRVEFGPSLQTGDGVHKDNRGSVVEFLESSRVICDIDQSDEGGRFYKNVTNYSLAEVSDQESILQAKPGIWLSLAEIQKLSRIKGMLTNELRTSLSLLLPFI